VDGVRKSHRATEETCPAVRNFYSKYPWTKPVLFGLLLVLPVLIAYSNSLDVPFYYDDRARILENEDIHMDRLSLDQLRAAAFGEKSAASRPVGNISFALNHLVHGLDVAGYRIVNIIIHAVNGLLLFAFLLHTLQLSSVDQARSHPRLVALFGALIWVLNPLDVQSVTYIVQRLNSLAVLFFLLAFMAYLKARESSCRTRAALWLLAALSWLLSLGCKQITITLPLVVLLYEWFFYRDMEWAWLRRQWKTGVVLLIILLLLTAVFLGTDPISRLTSLRAFADGRFSYTERLLTQPRVVLTYLSLVLFPYPARLKLVNDFPLSTSVVSPWTTLPSMAVIIALLFTAALIARRRRFIAFAVFWFFANLVVESTVIPLDIYYEHRTYLPSMLFWAAILAVVARWRYGGRAIVAAGVTFTIVFGAWTWQRNALWRTPLAFWQDNLEKCPQDFRVLANLGYTYADLEEPEKAIAFYERVLALRPKDVETRYNLGNTYRKLGDHKHAEQYYREALALAPDDVDVLFNLGRMLYDAGRYAEAISFYERILKVDPDHAAVHANLGMALLKQHREKPAIQHLERSVALVPDDAGVHYVLATLYTRKRQLGIAIQHYRQLLKLEPRHYQAHANLGVALMIQGKREEAVQHFRMALHIRPDLTEVRRNLKRALSP
jgi:Flp pilus assembly protein TadD